MEAHEMNYERLDLRKSWVKHFSLKLKCAHCAATIIARKVCDICKQTECLTRQAECTWRKHWNQPLSNSMEV